MRFLAENTFLVLLLPGPFEPSKEQLNECLEPVIENIIKLYEGKFLVSIDYEIHICAAQGR